MNVDITPTHRGARNQASIDLADTGPGVATLALYTAQGGTLLCTRTLLKPCATLDADKRIALAQDSAAVDLVTATGDVTWAQWLDAGGTPILGCTVTDEAGAGPIKLQGTVGTTVYEGGVVVITQVLIG